MFDKSNNIIFLDIKTTGKNIFDDDIYMIEGVITDGFPYFREKIDFGTMVSITKKNVDKLKNNGIIISDSEWLKARDINESLKYLKLYIDEYKINNNIDSNDKKIQIIMYDSIFNQNILLNKANDLGVKLFIEYPALDIMQLPVLLGMITGKHFNSYKLDELCSLYGIEYKNSRDIKKIIGLSRSMLSSIKEILND